MAYRRAEEIEPIAASLIDAWHPHLLGARILYLFNSKPMTSKGKTVAGKTSKLGELPRFLSGFIDGTQFDFLIVFEFDWWTDHADDPEAQLALIDHELSHCDMTEDGEWALAPHDVEEFSSIVRRRGLWREDLRQFRAAIAAHEEGRV